MKKTLLAALSAAFMVGAALCSCDETDTTSYMPIFTEDTSEGSSFEITPTAPRAGDVLRVTALQRKKGHLIYHADYLWTVRFATTNDGKPDTVVYTKKVPVVYDLENADPVLEYTIPGTTGGRIQVTFRGDYRYSGVGASGYDGSNYGSRSWEGFIFWKASSSADGCCEGSTRWITVRDAE